MKRHVLSILVEDTFGALSRITELFSSRGYNLESICSGSSEEPKVQRLTLVCTEGEESMRKIIQMLKQIIFVYDVKLIKPEDSIQCELMLVKLKLPTQEHAGFLKAVAKFNPKVVHASEQRLCIQTVGLAEQLDQLLHLVRQYPVFRVSRTGEAAIHGKNF